MITSAKAAHNGALLLDRLMPGWFDKIDLYVLDIGSTRRCILGQLFRNEEHYDVFSEEWYGGFEYVWDRLYDNHGGTSATIDRKMQNNGFACPMTLRCLHELTDAWHDEVTARR